MGCCKASVIDPVEPGYNASTLAPRRAEVPVPLRRTGVIRSIDIVVARSGDDPPGCDAEGGKVVEQQIEQQLVAALPSTVLCVSGEDHPIESATFALQSFRQALEHLSKGCLTCLCRQADDSGLAVIPLQCRSRIGDVGIRNVQERR